MATVILLFRHVPPYNLFSTCFIGTGILTGQLADRLFQKVN